MKKRINRIVYLVLIMVMILSFGFQVFASDLTVNAESALIIEKNTGKVIYDKEMNEQKYPASVTKVLTAIVVLENCKLDEVVTVKSSAISNIPEGYVIAPLFVDEQIKVNDLLYALMLKSCNDAAYVLAEHVGGSVEGFSEMMNQKAKEIGCKHTHFINPNGIHDANHYTTAYDMYLMSEYAMKNKTFAEIVSTYKYILPATNKYPNKDRVMLNTNSFINPKSSYYDKKVKGIKTGTTKEAGNCLITETTENGLDFITVVLGAETDNSRFSETKKMISYSFDNYKFTNIHHKNDVIQSIDVKKATKDTKHLDLVLSDDINVVNNVNTNVNEIEPEIVLNEKIVAPIAQGDELGTIKYTVEGIEYSAKLVAKNEVVLKTYYIEISVGAVILLIVVLIIKSNSKSKTKKKSRRR